MVRSPLAGVVVSQGVETGDVVSSNQQLFEVADLSTLVATVRVSELDVVRIRSGQPAEIVLDALPGSRFTGRVRRVFPAADSASRLVPVEVALDAEAARVARPGFLARVTFALNPRAGVVLVPAGSVLGDQGAQSVYVARDGVVTRREVETGVTQAGQVEIVSGVQAGEAVVVIGNSRLRDGDRVRVVRGPGGGREGAGGAGRSGGPDGPPSNGAARSNR